MAGGGRREWSVGGGQKNDKANYYLSGRSVRRLESCFGVACNARVMGG